MAGIDPASDGLARAARLGVATTAEGVDGLVALPEFADVERRVRRDVGGRARRATTRWCATHGARMVDLTPAAIGPYVVPTVNLEAASAASATSTWSPAAGRRRSRSWPRSAGSPGAVRRDRRLDRLAVGRPGHPRQHRRVHRDHRARARAGRRRRPRQGDHRAQPGRAAAGHARHRVLPRRRRRRRRRSRRRVLDAWSPRCRQYVPGYRLKHDVQFDAVDLPYVPALGRAFTRPAGDRVPGGARRRPLPARVRRATSTS